MKNIKSLSVTVPTMDADSALSEFVAVLNSCGAEKAVPYVMLRVANESRGNPVAMGDLEVYKRVRKGQTAWKRWIGPLCEGPDAPFPDLVRVPQDEFVSYGFTQMLSLVFQRHLADGHPAILVDPRVHAVMVVRGLVKAASLNLTYQDLFADTWAVGSYKRMPADYVVRKTKSGVRTIQDVRNTYWGWRSKLPAALKKFGVAGEDAEIGDTCPNLQLPDKLVVPVWGRGRVAEIDLQNPEASESSEDTVDANEVKEDGRTDEAKGEPKKIPDQVRMWEVGTPPGQRTIIKKVVI